MTKEEIAKTLKEYRIKSGLGAMEVAENLMELGAIKSVKSFYNWESGRTQPDADTFMYLCNLYEIDDVMKVFGHGKSKEKEKEENELVEAYEKADFDTKNNIRFMLKLKILNEDQDNWEETS